MLAEWSSLVSFASCLLSQHQGGRLIEAVILACYHGNDAAVGFPNVIHHSDLSRGRSLGRGLYVQKLKDNCF